MKIKHHIGVLFLVPIFGFIVVLGILFSLMVRFPLATYPFMVLAPLVAMIIVVLLSFATHYLHVSCPRCDKKLTFNNDPTIESPMYECENCRFERKGLFKRS